MQYSDLLWNSLVNVLAIVSFSHCSIVVNVFVRLYCEIFVFKHIKNVPHFKRTLRDVQYILVLLYLFYKHFLNIPYTTSNRPAFVKTFLRVANSFLCPTFLTDSKEQVENFRLQLWKTLSDFRQRTLNWNIILVL